METGILLRWGVPKQGRERESLELYREAVAYNRRLVQEGKLTSFEPFLFSTGDSEVETGGFLIKGPVTEVFAILDSTEFRDMANRSSVIMEHFRVDMLTVGEAIDRNMSDYQRALSAVGG